MGCGLACGAHNHRLQRFLDQKGLAITAERLAFALLQTAKPFALMYRGIWQALQVAVGSAAESVQIAIDQHLLPFDTFRRQALVAESILGAFAPETLLLPDVWDLLASIPRELGSDTPSAREWFRNRMDIYYGIGSKHALPRLPGGTPGRWPPHPSEPPYPLVLGTSSSRRGTQGC